MDKNVELLLKTEAEVNARVQQANELRRQKMASIQQEVDIEVREYRNQKDQEFEREKRRVSTAKDSHSARADERAARSQGHL